MKKKTNILYIETASTMGGSTNSLYYMIVNINKEKYKPIIISFNSNEIIDNLVNQGFTCYIINDIIYGNANRLLLKIMLSRFSTVRLGSCVLSTGAVFSVFGARLPVFQWLIALKLPNSPFQGSNKATFTLQSPGKTLGSSRCRS